MHKFERCIKKEKGFTLIEIISAIFVFTVGILAIMMLIDKNIILNNQTKSKLIAAYIAQEGIEIVRNIRDSNWIAKNPWDQGLSVGECYEIDYQGTSLSPCLGNYLNIDSNGFYSYSVGTPTKFKRKIIISDKTSNPPRMKITSRVDWEIKGKPYNIEIVEYLYNWK